MPSSPRCARWEIARKLTREMEENKVQSLSRTYAPNEYAVWLSPDDRNQFEGYERDLATELSGYLLEHARRADRAGHLAEDQLQDRRPAAAGRVRLPGAARAPGRRRLAGAEPGRRGPHDGLGASDRLSQELRESPTTGAARRACATRRQDRGPADGRRRIRPLARGATSCSPTRTSPASMQVRPSGGKWIVKDLGSTNGVKVNGRRITGPQSLRPGDAIELGTSTIDFDED